MQSLNEDEQTKSITANTNRWLRIPEHLSKGAKLHYEYAKRYPKKSNFPRRNFIIYISVYSRVITGDNKP